MLVLYKNTVVSILTNYFYMFYRNENKTTPRDMLLENPNTKKLKNCCNTIDDVKLLRSLGRVKDLSDGSSVIISSSNMTSFHMPRKLKMKNIRLWEKADYIWLNM